MIQLDYTFMTEGAVAGGIPDAMLSAVSDAFRAAHQRREPFSAVITDLGMPGMTGLALAAELKRLRHVPVILLTGWADELDPEDNSPVDLVVSKPFTREKLIEALARAVPDRVRPI